jgi:fatty-acyl-CoA synthase
MIADLVGIRQRDVILPVVPMFHINAWCLPYAAVMVGAKVVLPERHLDPASLLELIAGERVTLSAGAPAVWLGVLQHLDREGSNAIDKKGTGIFSDAGPVEKRPVLAGEKYPRPFFRVRPLQTLEKLVIGGSAAPKVLVQGFQERYGVTVLQAWGMTETTSLGTVCPAPADSDSPDAPYTSRTRQGVPTPFVEIRARGDAGLVPWDDETMGELEVRGPTVASGYYKAPEGTSCVTDDGWFRTGDIVTIDARGSVQLRDRSKDLIKSGSEWISSVALENALMGHPAVAAAAVIAVPHPRWDERPLACVVLKPGGTATAEELREYLAPDFAKWWLPDAIEFVDHIPRTATGKFLKSALRERFKNYRLPTA